MNLSADEKKARKKAADKAYAAANKEKLKAYRAAYYLKNKTAFSEYHRNRKANKKEEIDEYQKNYKNENRQLLAKKSAKYRIENPHQRAAADYRRRARSLSATPSWDPELTGFAMLESWDLARRRRNATGYDWHIDHMIPLQAKNACGLHTWANIQVIPAAMNISKKNRMLLTAPGEWIRSLSSRT